ncbi:hypothetical protein [Lactobacillus delbrueckii]|uniref:hypothetical protein n=1 Tax=Lactobacillus delbrueckii TaxID=1584 RepID=UPI001F375A78|nr:hypothetical protein [Lactobacillus delbrueckii]GHN43085.1 hypothetical protein ME797_04510 [Lactobacillus delbrueckii]
MSESKSASVVFTNSSLLAKNAQVTADSAKTAAEVAQNQAIAAQKTADGKNSVYRGSDPATLPTAGLKAGDLYFTANAVYTWTGTAWEKTVSDTTGTEINAKVEAAMQESQKSVADLKTDVEAKVKGLDDELAKYKIQIGNALSFYKEQYYQSTSYTELVGGSWSYDVPVKTEGKYIWSRYVTANVGDSTNYQYSDPVCISGLDGAQGPQGPKGEPGPTGFFIGTTPPPNPSKGTVWATTDASGNMTSAKTWDGSNWVSTAFTQDLVVGNITATKIVGGTLDVNKITIANAQNIPITSTVSLGDKLSSIEQDANGLRTTVSNLHAGDRNLARGVASSKDWFVFQGFNNLTNYCSNLVTYSLETLKAGDTVTFGITMKNEGVTSGTMIFQQYGDVSGWTRDYGSISSPANVTDFVPNETEKTLTYTTTITAGMLNGNSTYTIDIRTDNVPAGGKLSFRYAFVKKGTLAADWTPAPEDVDDSISQIKQTADGISAYVKGSRGSKTLESILSMDPTNSTIAQVVNGQVVAAINTSSDGSVKIDGKTLHITADTKIENAVIKSAMIDSIDASKITTGTLDASHINVINLDANSITTGSLSAALYKVTDFTNYFVSASSTWDFNLTKSAHGNWFLNGEITADHVYNGPKDVYGNKLTPYMYVTSRGSADGTRFTVTVWKDNDPTQYQRVWNGSSWSDWVMLPNSQNLISAINLSPDSVKISGKNIELNGNTRVADGFTLSADKISTGTLNGVTITGSTFVATANNINVEGHDLATCETKVDKSGVEIMANNQFDSKMYASGLKLYAGASSLGERTVEASVHDGNPYLKVTKPGSFSLVGADNIWSELVKGNEGQFANWKFSGSKVLAQSGSLYVANPAGGNFDGNGSVGFQVWGGIGLGAGTIYTPDTDIYIQQGNVGPALGQSYSSANKTTIHAQKLISQVANTVASRLSVKTDITPVSYDRALAAVEGTEMYDYRYVSDDSGQHYVSGIIDDVNPDPQYHMDEMLINKERTARIDSNLVGYHHVVLQKLLERVAALEEKVK